jgi:hypothetical protein
MSSLKKPELHEAVMSLRSLLRAAQPWQFLPADPICQAATLRSKSGDHGQQPQPLDPGHADLLVLGAYVLMEISTGTVRGDA